MARRLPEELAQKVTDLFPVAPGEKAGINWEIFDQMRRGGRALPHLIRIAVNPEVAPDEGLALTKSFGGPRRGESYLLMRALERKWKALKNEESWGFNGRELQEALVLADECEAALEAQGLNDYPILVLPPDDSEEAAAAA